MEDGTRRIERWEKNMEDWTEKKQESLRKIIDHEIEEKRNLAKEVFKVIKQNDAVSKIKCMIILGFKKKCCQRKT